MRLFFGLKCDKRYFIFSIITIICSIMLGIVLYNLTGLSLLFWNYTQNYIWFVFEFNNGGLIFPHILSEVVYLYLFFVIGYFTKFKYLSLILIFIRCTYFAIYTAMLIELNVLGGITVAVFVYIPISIISIFLCCFILESCKLFDKKFVFFVPLIFAIINTIIFLLLINVVFRVVIVIV